MPCDGDSVHKQMMERQPAGWVFPNLVSAMTVGQSPAMSWQPAASRTEESAKARKAG
jgi:hypothetical protein